MRAVFVSSIQRLWSRAITGVMFGLLQGAFSQPIQLDDVIQIGKEGGNAHGTALALGEDGSTFVTGHFSGLVDFDPGRGTADRTSAGDYDGFVVKLDGDRNLLWVKTFGGPYEEKSNAIALDSDGNICITGTFERTEVNEEFDKSADESRDEKGYFPLVGYDLFVMKLNGAGEEQWTRRFSPDARGDAEGWGIAVDSADNVLITGNFEGAMDLDPGDRVRVANAWAGANLLVLKLSASGDYVWARTVGSEFYDEAFGRGIAVDDANNVYTVGEFDGESDFDPGDGVADLESAGEQDMFVQKLDSGGDFVWARSFGGPSYDRGLGIAVDRDGAICTTGSFQGPVDFEYGPGETILSGTGTTDDPLNTLFVHKMDFNGNSIWARAANAPRNAVETGVSSGHGIAADQAGNLYITGEFDGTIDLDPGNGAYEVTSNSWWSGFFLQKLNTNGEFRWARHLGDYQSTIMGLGIAVDRQGDVQVTGEFDGYLDFDPGPGEHHMVSHDWYTAFLSHFDAGGNFSGAARLGGRNESVTGRDIAVDDFGNTFTTGTTNKSSDPEWPTGGVDDGIYGTFTAFVSKHSPAGELMWFHELAGSGLEVGVAIALDGRGNLYHVGQFTGTVDFDSGPGIVERTSSREWDYFLMKLDADGNLLWVQTLSGGDNEVLTYESYPSYTGLAITADEEGYVYLTGTFKEVFDMDPGAGEYPLSTPGWNAAFVAKLSPLGNLVWARALGSNDGVAAGNKIETDTLGNIYVMGHFSDTIDFDPGSGEDIRTSLGPYDMFIQKLDSEGRHKWVRTVGLEQRWGESSFGPVTARDLAVDCQGNVHTVGSFYGEIDFDPGDGLIPLASGDWTAAFIQKLDTEGGLIWAKEFGGEEGIESHSVSVDRYGSIYTTGVGSSRVDLDPGPTVSEFDMDCCAAGFVQKLDSSGGYVSGYITGSLDNYRPKVEGAVNGAGSVHVMSSFYDTLEFVEGEETTTLRSTGGEDTFVAVFSQPDFETIPEPCSPSPGGEAALLESVAITLSRAFDLVDSDGGGSLSWYEVVAEIPGITQQHVDAIDTNGDGLLVEGELDSFLPAGEGEGEGEEPVPGCPLEGSRMAKHISDALGEILLFGLSLIGLMIGGWRKAL